MREFVTAVAAIVLLSLASTPVGAFAGVPVSALVPKAAKMEEGRRVLPPLGAIEFCARHRSECRTLGGSSEMRLTRKRWAELVEINRSVNRAIHPADDPMDGPIRDRWSVGGTRGDCEDYALAKRHELIARGWPSSAVLLAVAYSRPGVSHAVAVARTDRGDFVLDNLRQDIRAWDRTGYRWVKRQSWRHPEVWVRVQHPAPPPPRRKPELELADAGERLI